MEYFVLLSEYVSLIKLRIPMGIIQFSYAKNRSITDMKIAK